MSASTARRQTLSVRATGVVMGANEFTLSLSDGHEITVPYWCYPRLQQAIVEQRRHFDLYGGGRMLCWPDVDEDVDIRHVIEGRMPERTGSREPVVVKARSAYRTQKTATVVAEGGTKYGAKKVRPV